MSSLRPKVTAPLEGIRNADPFTDGVQHGNPPDAYSARPSRYDAHRASELTVRSAAENRCESHSDAEYICG